MGKAGALIIGVLRQNSCAKMGGSISENPLTQISSIDAEDSLCS